VQEVGQLTHSQEQGGEFTSEKTSRTAKIVLNGSVTEVFPLFNPVEESKWEPRFQPSFIYPADHRVQKGMTFKTPAHGQDGEFVWRINEYDEATYHIQYLVFAPHQVFTITIDCEEVDEMKTSARVTYEFIALEVRGIALNEARGKRIFADDLSDWERSINRYLERR